MEPVHARRPRRHPAPGENAAAGGGIPARALAPRQRERGGDASHAACKGWVHGRYRRAGELKYKLNELTSKNRMRNPKEPDARSQYGRSQILVQDVLTSRFAF